MAELGYFVVPSRLDSNLDERYILVNDIYVQHTDFMRTRNRNKKFSTTKPEVCQYLKGTLLRRVIVRKGEISGLDKTKVLCKHSESDIYFQCHKSDVGVLNEDVYNLLLAMANCRDRFEIYENRVRLAEGLEMDVGTEVSVKVPSIPGEVKGIIKSKGFVHSREGTLFGVQLLDAEGMGNTDGTYGKQRYFSCGTDCGIFLSLNRVRPLRNRVQSPIAAPRRNKQTKMSATNSRSRQSPNEVCPNTLQISKDELSKLGITHGAEVYIFTEVRGSESQEKGKVKFIGRLPGSGSKSEIYVGIDLDKPVGNGTGLYSGKHLFYTKQNHAALVPLNGVLPAYINDIPDTPARNHVYEDMDSVLPSTSTVTTSRRSHREFNGSSTHGYHTEELPLPLKKTFTHFSRNAHSSPSILSVSRSNRPEKLIDTGTNRRSSPSSRLEMTPMDVDFNETQESNPNRDRDRKLYDQHSKQSSKRSAFNRYRRENSSGNVSEDELPSQLDLYGSDDTMRKNVDKRDLYDTEENEQRSTSPIMQEVLRPHTLPGFRTPSNRRNGMQARSALTAPGLMTRTKSPREESPRLGELVAYNSISNGHEFHDNRDYAEMEVGTMVEVTEGIESVIDIGPTYGVIKWIGELPGQTETVAGIEFDSAVPNGTDGTFSGVRYFDCEYGRGWFVFLRFCKKDRRFLGSAELGATAGALVVSAPLRDFGNFESPRIPGSVAPPRNLTEDMVGKRRGIQGHHNSCYLDSTLFSLFAYSQVLDTILFRKKSPKDLPEYEETQKVLKELIINPLRRNNFVRADRIMQLRELLEKLGSVTGLVSEEKDPEEFLNILLAQVFKAEPLMELRQGSSNAAHESYYYQIFMEKDEKMGIPSTQQLLEKSVISADLKFQNVPVCLILQMPRFGKDYKMYKKLKPSLTLDITDLVEEMPRSCDICEEIAEYECRDCFLEGSLNEFVFSYCKQCAERVHTHRKRKGHCFQEIKLPPAFREHVAELSAEGKHVTIERQKLELFAVVCIATSHYVSFAKCGNGKDSTWCFFDSMADRVGEQSGYNIPEVTHCPQVEAWLQWDEKRINEFDDKTMPELMRRLLCDAYMCMYQSTDLMFHK